MPSSLHGKKELAERVKMSDMSIKKTLISAIALAVLLTSPVIASAGHKNKHVTPYGDFCDRVSNYGMHKHMLDIKEVRESLTHYFGDKGLNYEIIKDKGRFMKVVIKDNNNVVDTIIFDRHTGRIRSIN